MLLTELVAQQIRRAVDTLCATCDGDPYHSLLSPGLQGVGPFGLLWIAYRTVHNDLARL